MQVQYATLPKFTNNLEIERSSKITEGGFSYPAQKEYRGLENPRSVEEKMNREYY